MRGRRPPVPALRCRSVNARACASGSSSSPGPPAAHGHRQREPRLVLGRGPRSATLDAQLDHALGAGRRRAPTSSTSAASPASPTPTSSAAEVEIERVVPLVERLVAEGVTVSVDTFKPAVAARGARRGRGDGQRRQRPARPRARRRCAPQTGAALVVMHTRAAPKEERFPDYERRRRRRRRARFLPSACGRRARAAASRADAARPRPRAGLRQDAGRDDRGAARRWSACARSAGRCCWPSRASTSSARSPAARPSERLAGTLAAVAHGVAAGADDRPRPRRRRDASTSSRVARGARAGPRSCRAFDAGDEALEVDPPGLLASVRVHESPAADATRRGRPPTTTSKEDPMSVLSRAALEGSPLADLHVIASELGIDGFRRLRKAELVDAILDPPGRRGRRRRRRRRRGRRRGRRRADAARRGGRGRRGRRATRRADAPRPTATPTDEAPRRRRRATPTTTTTATSAAPRARPRGGRGRDRDARPRRDRDDDDEEQRRRGRRRAARQRLGLRARQPARARPTTTSTSPPRRCAAASSSPATRSPARCARRAAPSATRRSSASTPSTAAAPTRSPRARRSTTCPPRSRPSASRSARDDPTLKAIEWLTPIGRGSRVTIVGGRARGQDRGAAPPGRRARRARTGLEVSRRARRRAPRGGRRVEGRRRRGRRAVARRFAASPDAQAQAVERAVETARRVAARGGNAVVLVDTLDGLHPPGRAQARWRRRATSSTAAR